MSAVSRGSRGLSSSSVSRAFSSFMAGYCARASGLTLPESLLADKRRREVDAEIELYRRLRSSLLRLSFGQADGEPLGFG